MKDLEYKGFIGSVEFDKETNELYGKIKFIKGLISYESEDQTMSGLITAFEDSIDEYLQDCLDLGIDPQKTATGVTQVRLGKRLHYKANFKACEEQITLNELITKSVANYIENKGIHVHHHKEDHNHFYEGTSFIDKKYPPTEYSKHRKDFHILTSNNETREKVWIQ